MTPNEFESHIVGAVKSALKSGVIPPIVFTVLHSQADNVMKLMKRPPPDHPEGGIITPDEPVILTPGR